MTCRASIAWRRLSSLRAARERHGRVPAEDLADRGLVGAERRGTPGVEVERADRVLVGEQPDRQHAAVADLGDLRGPGVPPRVGRGVVDDDRLVVGHGLEARALAALQLEAVGLLDGRVGDGRRLHPLAGHAAGTPRRCRTRPPRTPAPRCGRASAPGPVPRAAAARSRRSPPREVSVIEKPPVHDEPRRRMRRWQAGWRGRSPASLPSSHGS